MLVVDSAGNQLLVYAQQALQCGWRDHFRGSLGQKGLQQTYKRRYVASGLP